MYAGFKMCVVWVKAIKGGCRWRVSVGLTWRMGLKARLKWSTVSIG